MRNLMMRLNSRPLDDLHRIAGYWRVPISDGPKHRIVGALYRTMTDPRAGRDVWERLTEEERNLIAHLALTSESATSVADLARRLDLDEQQTHKIAARLYRVGIIAREGDDDSLPIGAVPRLFLPLEVWQLFRRVRDEQDLRDLSHRPLRTLLELLDDPELEEAAGHWGLRVIPGLRQRDDLIQQILNLTADPERREAVLTASTRRREARALWEAVLAASERPPNGTQDHNTPVALNEALTAAGLTHDDDPAAALRTRSLLDSFESRLLLWHSYDAEGNRFLFIPSEIRNPDQREKARPTLPTPLDSSDVDEPAWRFSDALAWDLLTLLRALGTADAPRGLDPEEFPKSWLRRINTRLWIAGDEVPPRGYLSFMVAMARDEGLLVVGDRHGTASLIVGSTVRAWRTRSFPEQTAQLRLRWLSSTGWPEGAAREDLAVEGADWRGFRRKLLVMLADLEASVAEVKASDDADSEQKIQGETARWYPLEPLAAWLAARDPDLLGETFSAASAGFAGSTGAERRRSAIANAVIGTMTTALNWFGMVELGTGPGHTAVVRINPAMLTPSTMARAEVKPRTAQRGGPMTVTLDGRIELRVPSPVRVWSLLAFSEPEVLDQVSLYRLTEPALSRALVAGFDVEQVVSFLDRQTAGELPQEVIEDLRSWAKGFRRVRVRQAVVLRPDDPSMVADLERLVNEAGWDMHRLGENEIVVVVPPEAAERDHLSDLDQVTDALRTAGFHPN